MFNSQKANDLWNAGKQLLAAETYVKEFFANYGETVTIKRTAYGEHDSIMVFFDRPTLNLCRFDVWKEPLINSVYGEY